MRKIVVEVSPNKSYRDRLKDLFNKVESMRAIEILKLDFDTFAEYVIAEYKMKEGFSIEEADLPESQEILHTLKSEGNVHICLVKESIPKKYEHEMKEFDMDVIWIEPWIVTEDKIVCSCIGDNENINKFIEYMKKYVGDIQDMRITKALYQEHDIVSILTDKQREILIAAKKHGYYKYPRKINSEELAKKIGISKGTTVEHLRKAEERIIENILTGY